MYKAIIFDMDGVLINAENLWKRAENEVFTSLGVKVTEEYSELTKSMTTSEVTEFWYDKYPWNNITQDEAEQKVVSRVMELISTENCQIQGVKSFIQKLKSKNLKIGIATNSPHKVIPVVLKKLGIEHLVDSISSAEFEKKGKPHPSIYFNTAQKLNIEPEHCIVIEDSYKGMLAAKNAGMTVVAFTNGYKEIDFNIADYKIENFEKNKIDFI